MSSVDFRTRFAGTVATIDPHDLTHGDLAALIDERSALAGAAAARLGLVPLTLEVDGEAATLTPSVDGLVAHRGNRGAVVVSLDRSSFSELIEGASSTFGLSMTGRAQLTAGDQDAFVRWEPVLRWLFDGRTPYVPGTIDFHDRDGSPLDLHRSFTLEDDPADMSHFVAEAGFLHLAGVFTEDEMAAVAADQDAAIGRATPDDGASWWAMTEAGERYPARILGFNQQSPALRELLRSDRYRSIGRIMDDEYVQRNPDQGDSAEGLLKKVGVIEGISDVSWHKDCAMGGHNSGCCGLITGISVTGAGRENGELGVVAGSHRANIAPLGTEGLDLPKVPLPTGTGDITVHCSCTLHMSRPPVSATRRVVYTGFALAPRDGDHRKVRTDDEIRADRASLNDHVRRHQAEGPVTAMAGSFEL